MGDADGYWAALLGGAEEGAVGGAFGLDDVIGVVGEGLAGLQVGELADAAVAFDDQGIAFGVFDDPFATEDVDGLGGVIVNGNLVVEGMGAVSGAGMAASQAALAGGTWSDILRAGVTGAVTGAISAAIGAKVLHGLSVFADEAANFGSWFGWHALRSAGHGVVGGGLSELTGGNFKDGFIGAGVGALLSPMTGALNKGLGLGAPGDGGTGWQFLGRTATAGVVGGTATAISGGKFGNGAVTAAFMHVVNDEVVESKRMKELAAIYGRHRSDCVTTMRDALRELYSDPTIGLFGDFRGMWNGVKRVNV